MPEKYDFKFDSVNKNKWIEDDMGNTVMIEGVGKDAEIVTNEKGGKQSKAPMAMHLIDPYFLNDWFRNREPEVSNVIENITAFMRDYGHHHLRSAIEALNRIMYKDTNNEDLPDTSIVTIAKVLQQGAEKYEPNNWRLIPQEEHINHALIHFLAYLIGDTQDDHLAHCMCRLMMAYTTKRSTNFNYTKYVSQTDKQAEEEFYDRL